MLQKHISCSSQPTINSHPVREIVDFTGHLWCLSEASTSSSCNMTACGFFIIKICGVDPQSNNFRHFITLSAHRSFAVSIYGRRRKSIFNLVFSAFHHRLRFTSIHNAKNLCKIPGGKTFAEMRLWMKNLNWTEHEKRFVEKFYGCLNWTFSLLAPLSKSLILVNLPRIVGITSLREYQCRKIGLNFQLIDFSIFRWVSANRWNCFVFIGFLSRRCRIWWKCSKKAFPVYFDFKIWGSKQKSSNDRQFKTKLTKEC